MNSSGFDIKNSGFTLIVLMISLTIIGIILVIVFGSFRIGVRAWEHGGTDMIEHQRQRIILQRIKQQLASAIVNKIEIDNDEESFFFKGDEAVLEFTSDASLIPGNDFGRVYVKYIVESDQNDRATLKVYEKNLFLLTTELKRFSPESDEFRELLSDIKHISFKFLKINPDQQLSWFQEWEINDDEGLPDAVQISVQMDNKFSIVHVLARIIQEAKEAKE
ncbi:MAG: type II secretion system protein [Desulfobacteraceae bacterium]|nr:type II secretion system protein [Desulfobacteraceae bacterium]